MNKLTQEEEAELNLVLERLNTGDHYNILGVSPESDIGDIRIAYFTLSKIYHPDMFYRRAADGVLEKVEAIFTGINLSYEVLSDEVERRKFDVQLMRRARDSGGSRSRTRRGERPEVGAANDASVSDEVLGEDAATSTRRKRVMGARAKARARIREELGVSKSRGVRQLNRSSNRRHRSRQSKGDQSETTGRFESELREKLNQRLAKAKAYYDQGMEALEQEDWAKAASSFQMAMQFDDDSEQYKKAYLDVKPKAASVRAAGFIRAAESAESFRNVKEAIYNYQQAVACNPPEGIAYYRLGRLLLDYASEPREALKNFRKATSIEPSELKYRLALADLYVAEGMEKNAHREYQKVLQADPKNKSAKSGLKKLRF